MQMVHSKIFGEKLQGSGPRLQGELYIPVVYHTFPFACLRPFDSLPSQFGTYWQQVELSPFVLESHPVRKEVSPCLVVPVWKGRKIINTHQYEIIYNRALNDISPLYTLLRLWTQQQPLLKNRGHNLSSSCRSIFSYKSFLTIKIKAKVVWKDIGLDICTIRWAWGQGKIQNSQSHKMFDITFCVLLWGERQEIFFTRTQMSL